MVQQELVREVRGGEAYAYYPLGEYVVAAPGVCGGRPTFKGTRMEAAAALSLMAAGYSMDQIAQRFEVTQLAVAEAIHLAAARLDDWKIAA
jgi:uncharacterized protein (DUF433 family)